jgi:hypothetical protein
MTESIHPAELGHVRELFLQAEIAQLKAREAHLSICIKYGLGPTDQLNLSTGEIIHDPERGSRLAP